ncbi:MAG: PAS domain S-box protein [Nitrospirae bacterium]|nr:PAS domain S-box protein [Nitrospirota bacterium]NTW65788.1 PAS domain S-box protein [Nitrospirota bacterium]
MKILIQISLAAERLVRNLIAKYCPFPIRTFQIFIGVITFVISITILLLGWQSSVKIRDVVTEDFNQQQLVLAQYAARQIENSINILRRDILLLGNTLSTQHRTEASIERVLVTTAPSSFDQGALAIRYVNARNHLTHVVDGRGYRREPQSYEDRERLEWARQAKHGSDILVNDVKLTLYDGTEQKKLIMYLSRSVWRGPASGSQRATTVSFAGVLVFVLDAGGIAESTTKSIRSGKTGYAWVLDNKGIFLYHPEGEFIGENAFEARKKRQPAISFDQINEIQRELMLKGKEGKSSFLSGWHRGEEGRIKKLIAYTPVRFDPEQGRIWSVAVVAPVSEVEGAIRGIQVRQFLLEGIVIIAIIAGGLLIISLVFRWSESLSVQVEKRTRELAISENQYRSLIENANDIIFTTDRDGTFLSINQAGYMFFHKVAVDLIGRSLGEICFNEHSAFLQFKAIEDVADSRESRQLTYPVTIEGEEYWISTNFTALQDEKGSVHAVLGIARDVTESKRREERMYHTEKLASIGTLAAGVAHEINNPLAVILGFADMLLGKTPPNTETYDILKTIEKQGNNAKRVVENLLSFARYREPKDEFIDINKNIEEMLAVAGNTLRLHKIALKKMLAPHLPAVKGDARELQQVFFNIINNAVAAMDGSGMLTVETAAGDDDHHAVQVRISDTGHGIRKEHRSKIFDPLFTTKPVGQGTGLGLSVSYGIVSKYGGTITFETRTEDESPVTGTTFVITLPTAEDDRG